jgi:hypothetical protein
MTKDIKTDLLDILEPLYEHGYTPKQAMERIYARIREELSIARENWEKNEQITVKLGPIERQEIPVVRNEKTRQLRVCLQEGDLDEENKEDK